MPNVQTGSAAGAPEKRSWITLSVAIILALLYVGASWLLLNHFVLSKPPGDDATWQRALVIYNGIASVGFAAIGVLLGTSVQQVNLAAAQKDANAAKQEASDKGNVIKGALDKLSGVAPPSSAEAGGGAAAALTQVNDARKILLGGLR